MKRNVDGVMVMMMKKVWIAVRDLTKYLFLIYFGGGGRVVVYGFLVLNKLNFGSIFGIKKHANYF